MKSREYVQISFHVKRASLEATERIRATYQPFDPPPKAVVWRTALRVGLEALEKDLAKKKRGKP